MQLQVDQKEITIVTRSMLQVMMNLASAIEVPVKHVADKRVASTFGQKASDGLPMAALVIYQLSAGASSTWVN